MTLENYKVTFGDGSVQHYQFEEEDAGLKALRDAAKASDSDVKSVAKSDPAPANK